MLEKNAAFGVQRLEDIGIDLNALAFDPRWKAENLVLTR
jgi:hypothetical protein